MLVLVLIIAAGVLVLGGGIALVIARGRRELPPPDVLDEITEEAIEHPEHPEPHLEDEPTRPRDDRAARGPPGPAGAAARPAGQVAGLARPGPARRARPCRPRRRRVGGARGHPARRRRRRRPTTELVDALRTRVRVEGIDDPERAKAALREELVGLVDPALDRTLGATGGDGKPGVVLVVGVNGTGKTTTVGRLARVLVADGKTRGARRRRHVPRRRRRPAADLGRAGRRRHRPRPRGRRPGQRGVRGRAERASTTAPTSSWSTPPAGCTPRPA